MEGRSRADEKDRREQTANLDEREQKEKAGIVYLSRIPSNMSPHELRRYLEPFGRVGRIYLAPDERYAKVGRSNVKRSHRRQTRFKEGWVEFVNKKDAKTATLALNGARIGGKKSNRLYDEIWNIKYLKGFQWNNLREQEHYDRIVSEQRLRTEISQARRSTAHFLRQAARARELEKIEETRRAQRAKREKVEEITPPPPPPTPYERDMEQMALLAKRFKQRKPILSASLPTDTNDNNNNNNNNK